MHSYFPEFPRFERAVGVPLFGNTWLSFWFSPPWTGFFYFVNLDISASIWVFYVLVRLQRGIFNTLGVQSTQRIDFYSEDPFLAHQGLGAMIAFVVVGLWVARRHLRDVVAKAVGGLREVDDSGEILSYRQAFFGLLTGLLTVAIWLSDDRPALPGGGAVRLRCHGPVHGADAGGRRGRHPGHASAPDDLDLRDLRGWHLLHRHPRSSGARLLLRLARRGPLLCDGLGRQRAEDERNDPRPEAPAVLGHCSGHPSQPSGLLLRHPSHGVRVRRHQPQPPVLLLAVHPLRTHGHGPAHRRRTRRPALGRLCSSWASGRA